MRVRCRATADYRSNAVGAVELECAPAGLSVTLAGVSSYQEGYAPGPPVRSPSVCVPWAAVYATLLGTDELLLSVDASRLPLNRFRLSEFVQVATPESARDAQAWRLRWAFAMGAAAVATLALVLSSRGALPHPDAVRTLGASVLLVALVAAVLRAAARRRLGSDQVLRELSLELAQHLPHHIPSEPPAPRRRRALVPTLSARLPRSAFAVAVTLAATSLAAIVGSSAARPRATPGAEAPAAAAASRVASSAAAWPGAPGAPELEPPAAGAALGQTRAALGDACRCRSDESWLRSTPMPRVSPLVVASSQRAHDGHPHLEVELALINNSLTPLVDLTLTVLFHEESAAGGERETGERALHVDGLLAPGRAARWHVEGLGTSVDLIGPDLGSLATDGSDAAPAEAFAELAAAPERALRLHGTRLLAFLGDERARGAALALRPGASEGETAVLERLLDESPLVACDLSVAREASGQWRTHACVYNRSVRERALSMARLLAFAEPFDPARPGARVPELIAELPSRLAAELPAGVGRRLELLGAPSVEEGRVPRAFELILEEKVE